MGNFDIKNNSLKEPELLSKTLEREFKKAMGEKPEKPERPKLSDKDRQKLHNLVMEEKIEAIGQKSKTSFVEREQLRESERKAHTHREIR